MMYYFWAVIWVDSEQKEHHLIASINQAKDWETEDVFTFDFDGTTVDAGSSVSADHLGFTFGRSTGPFLVGESEQSVSSFSRRLHFVRFSIFLLSISFQS
jgi:hypothetical protein